MTIWVVVTQRVAYNKYDDLDWDLVEVQDKAYPTKELAEKRKQHLIEEGKARRVVSIHPVKFRLPDQLPVSAEPVRVTLPPSLVWTEDNGPPMQIAYDAPRRVFVHPASVAFSQQALDSLAEGGPAEPLTPQVFQVSPEGQLELFPRGLPVTAR